MIVEALKSRLPEEYECDPVCFFGVNHIISIERDAVDLFVKILTECLPKNWKVLHSGTGPQSNRLEITFETGKGKRGDWHKSNLFHFRLEEMFTSIFSSVTVTRMRLSDRGDIDGCLRVSIDRIPFTHHSTMVVDVGEGAFPAYDIVTATRRQNDENRAIALTDLDQDVDAALRETKEAQAIMSLISKLDTLRNEKNEKIDQLRREVDELMSATRWLHNTCAAMKDLARESLPVQEEWKYVQERLAGDADDGWSRAGSLSNL